MNRTLKHPYSKRDSGSLVIFISNKLKDRVSLVKKVSDCIIWLKFDASLFDLNDDILMGLCYNTPEGNSREVYDDKSIFDMILEDMVNFEEVSMSRCKVFVCGDFNARTGIRNDFVENDSDLLMICYLMTMILISRYLDFLRIEYVMNMVYAYLTYVKVLGYGY